MKKKALKFTLQIILLISLLYFPGGQAYGQVIYVDAGATGAENGSSWNDAYTELADALLWAREQHDGGSPGWTEADPLQIWVAEGEYKPLYSATDGQYTTDAGRDNAFVMVPNVQLYGGFDPDGGIDDLEDARILPSAGGGGTFLSGDIDNTPNDNTGNAYHVLISAGEVGSALLDGFTVTGGYIDNIGSITVNGETIDRAAAGGIYVENASPAWSHIVVENNTTVDPGVTGFGTGAAGIFVRASSSMWDHITVRNNSTSGSGGGIFESSSSSTWTNVTVTDNTADLYGGGMHNVGSSPELTNVTLAGNTANIDGGGMLNSNSSPVLANTIVWGNTGGSIVYPDGTPTAAISFSLIAGSGGSGSWNTDMGTDGGNNIDADPQFADPANGDYSLTAASPAINTGSNQAYEDAGGDLENDLDLAGEARVYDVANGGVIDMGAYEFQGEPAEITFTKAFDGPAQPGNTVTLEFTIENQFASPLTNLSFTDDLDATLSGLIAIEFPADGFCGAGSQLSGTGNLTFTGGSLDANSSCTFSVTLQVPASALAGDYPNTTSSLTGVMDGNAVTVDPAVDTLTVEELSITPDENNILYVDLNVDAVAPGFTGTGDSWANAVPELADALRWAREQHDGGTADWDEADPLQIWVAEGEYKPLYNAADGQYTTDGGRDNAFVMVPNVQLYGGFDPDGGIDDLNDERLLPSAGGGGTILSGDIGTPNENSDNAYHVLISAGEVGSARLDGFTLTGGNADYPNTGFINVNGQIVQYRYGGGVYNFSSSPTLVHISISNNSTDRVGGGMYNDGSFPVLTNVTFSGNSAREGGGMYNRSNSSPVLTHVHFINNTANNIGGGMYNSSSSPVLTNVTFSGNTAEVGGGMTNGGSSPVLTNVTLSGNTANQNGGGMYNYTSSPVLANTIIWGNTGGSIGNERGATPAISHSLIANSGGSGSWNTDLGTDGGNNIDADPRFTDPGNGDYSLTAASPAINTGSNQAYEDADGDSGNNSLQNDTDLAGEARVYDFANGGVIDMGAYEFQGEPETPLTLTVGEGWRMLSNPIVDETYAGMLDPLWTQGVPGSDYEGDESTFQNVYTWNLESPNTCLEGEECPEWLPVDLTQTGPIPAGSGFLVYVFEDDDFDGTIDPAEEAFDKTLTLSGPRHSGDISPDINTNPGGWTLVGNPYGQPVAFSALERTEVNDAAYIYDANTDPNAVPDDGPTNGNGGAWRSTVSNLYGDITDGVIAPGQGFFVQTAEGATNPSLVFSESDQTSGGEFYGKESEPALSSFNKEEPRDYVRLEVQGESGYNSAWIRFSENGSTERTKGEALELQPLDAEYTILAARKADGVLMDIAHYPLDAQDLEIPLALEATQSGEFTITATDLDLPAGMSLYLYDRHTGQSMPLGEDFEYRFDLDVEKITKNSPLKRGAKGGVSQAKNTTPEKDSPSAQASRSTVVVGPAKAATTGTDRFLITTTPGKPASELPGEIALGQNYPNPFNPSTVISYQLPQQSQVRLDVYDMLGRRVATLVDEQMAAGTHQVNFDASRLSSGVYLYRLTALGSGGSQQIFTKKLTLIK